MLPTNYVPTCAPPGQLVMFRVPAERGLAEFTVVDSAGFERLTTNAIATAMFFTRQLLLAEGEAWVRSSDATCARVAPDGIDTDDPTTGWVRTLALALEVAR